MLSAFLTAGCGNESEFDDIIVLEKSENGGRWFFEIDTVHITDKA